MNQVGNTLGISGGQNMFANSIAPLSRASTLPPECYISSEIFQKEIERIFLKEWLCVGRADQVPNPGDYFTLRLINEPVVVVRDDQNQVQVLSTVCRHRAMEVVDGEGHRNSFQCPYHAWTYSLRGELIGAPEMELTEGFNRKECRLPALRVEIWEGFIFVNFDSAAKPLGPQLKGLSQLLRNYRLAEMKTLKPKLTYPAKWNWKVMVENYMECYHHIGLHKDTVESVFPARNTRTQDLDGLYGVIETPSMEPVVSFSGEGFLGGSVPVIETLTPEERRTALVIAVYPTHLLLPVGDAVAYYQVLPEAPDQCALSIYICVPPNTLERPDFADIEKRMFASVAAFNDEDMWANACVQRGLSSRLFSAGRYCHLEKAVWQFARYVAARMGA